MEGIMRMGFTLLLGVLVAGCGVIKEKPPEEPTLIKAASNNMTPEKADKVLETATTNWAFGQGMGDTAINVGAVMAFPPYLAVVVGNAALNLSGYEPITVSGLLPEEEGKAWANGYDALASAPGRATAAMSGREYRTSEVIKDDMRKLLSENAAADEGAERRGGAAR
jgi:hypothetical protein